MINRFGSPVISIDCIRLLPIVSGVTIVSISFLRSIAAPRLGRDNHCITAQVTEMNIFYIRTASADRDENTQTTVTV
jgi:hypothetical protein